MPRTIAAIALAAVTGLAACEPVPVGTPDAVPGVIRLSAGEAAGFFQSVCVRNANDLAGTIAAVSGPNYRYNTEDARYYHQTLDLSFAVGTISAGRVSCEIGWRGSSSQSANQSAIGNVSRNSAVRYDGSIDVFFAQFITAV